MALRPSLSPHHIAGKRDSPNTLEVFRRYRPDSPIIEVTNALSEVDYVCPFSAKFSRTIDSVLKPQFDEGGKYYGKVQLVVRQQVQPWHGSSTFTHEAALAVIRASPEHFWQYSRKLFDRQEEFYDIPTSTLTPLQIREKLAEIAASVIQDKGKVEVFKEHLKLKSTPNGGVAVTDDLKYTIKLSRQNGIHVSPTALWNGLVANEISSSWGEVEWSKFLSEKV